MEKKPLSKDQDFETEDKKADIYDEEGRDELEQNDEINEVEEGFVEGFEEGEHEAVCAECSSVLVGSDFIEETLDGKNYRFCSEECATAFETGKTRKQGRLNKQFKD